MKGRATWKWHMEFLSALNIDNIDHVENTHKIPSNVIKYWQLYKWIPV